MQYLLSDNLGVVCRLHFERAVAGPQVDRVGYRRTASFINLSKNRVSNFRSILGR
jgi:hypothetical protein